MKDTRPELPPDDPFFADAQPAFIRATRKALLKAKLHGVGVPILRNGKVVWADADDLLEELNRKYPDSANMNNTITSESKH